MYGKISQVVLQVHWFLPFTWKIFLTLLTKKRVIIIFPLPCRDVLVIIWNTCSYMNHWKVNEVILYSYQEHWIGMYLLPLFHCFWSLYFSHCSIEVFLTYETEDFKIIIQEDLDNLSRKCSSWINMEHRI